MKLSLRLSLLGALVASAITAHAQTTLMSYVAVPQGTLLTVSNPQPAQLTSGSVSTFVAQPFTTGLTGAVLTSAKAQVEVFLFPPGLQTNQTFTAYLFASSGGAPVATGSGGLLATSTTFTSSNTVGLLSTVTFTFSSNPILAANTTYDLVLGSTGVAGTFNDWDPARYLKSALSGWSIPDVAGVYVSTNSGASWSFNSGAGPLTLDLVGTPIPEPSTYAAIFGGLALGVAFWRKAKRERKSLA